MTHLEGPVVDGFYEIALHSWYNRLSPPLPCMTTPYQPPRDSMGRIQYLFQDHNPFFDNIEVMKAARAARLLLRKQTKELDVQGLPGRERLRDTVKKIVDQRRQTLAEWNPAEEIDARRQLAVEQIRDFRDRWGIGGGIGSRSNSRAPSRRASTIEIPTRSTGKPCLRV